MPDEQNINILFAGQHLSLVAHNGWEWATRETKNPAVAIVAITDDGCVLLVEQFRPPVGEKVIEIPAGLSGDVAGAENESLLDSAKRELLEETGYAASRWTELTAGYSSPGLTDELIVLFLAEGLEKHGPGGGDQTEGITVHEVAINDVMKWLTDRSAKVDLKLLAGLHAVQNYRREQDKSNER